MSYVRNFLFWVVFFALLVVTINLFTGDSVNRDHQEIKFSEFLARVDKDQIRDVTVSGFTITGHLKNGQAFSTYALNDPGLADTLYKKGIDITAKPPTDGSPTLLSILISWFPMLLLIGIWLFFMRQMQGGGGRVMGFGKSRAKLQSDKEIRVTFDDIAGIDEAKGDLQEIVDFLREPIKFQRLGGRIPKGVLLVGPPGTGKTLLAKGIAGEARVPFFSISGSDFVEMFVGVGASRVRDMFEQAKKSAPCIVFIDEIDAVGRHRGVGLGGGNDEREQTLNQLLVEMDGFEPNEGIILVAATNRPDVLDPALLRPGRFDRQIVVPNPDLNGRQKILEVHVRKVPLAPDVDLRVIARGTPGFSGADLANLINEAALLSARRNKKMVTMAELEESKDKVLMGSERRSMAMSDKEKALTAYHEGGHALVALHKPACDPIHKATIIPRGRALGMVMRLPEADQLSVTREKMKADLAVAMGGRVAEEIIFGHEQVTSGASSDIQMATRLAKAMITRYGMSEKLGPLFYAEGDDDSFLGSMRGSGGHISPDTQHTIDEEVRSLVDEAHKEATRIISENLHQLKMIAEALLKYETLSGDEIKNILDGKMPQRDNPIYSETAPLMPSVPVTASKKMPPPEAAEEGKKAGDTNKNGHEGERNAADAADEGEPSPSKHDS